MLNGLAELVHERFAKCKFKIPADQWTVLAGIAIKRSQEAEYEVVSIGAGLKCLPLGVYSKSRSLNEAVVHDCHGEILARRGFLCYILDQISREKELGDFCIVEKNFSKWKFKDGITVHMYISHAPCGDASMHNHLADDDGEADLNTASKRLKYTSDCTLRRGREDFSAVPGSLRTKPGRADAPFSACMSCSDKIGSWNVLGMQGGALMSLLQEPVFLSEIIVGDEYETESLQRALIGRIIRELLGDRTLNISKSDVAFEFSKTANQTGCFESHVWYAGCNKPETIVKGRRKGSASPIDNILPPASQSCVSKAKILAKIQEIVPGRFESYQDAKTMDVHYQSQKDAMLRHPTFKDWIRGPKP